MLGIASQTSIHACFEPLMFFFSPNKFIPLMWAPLMLEFEIVSGATGAVVAPNNSGVLQHPTRLLPG